MKETSEKSLVLRVFIPSLKEDEGDFGEHGEYNVMVRCCPEYPCRFMNPE